MNRIERKVLGPCLKSLRAYNPHLWWELKRQIWDWGTHSYYPWQSNYEAPARHLIERLKPNDFQMLESEWAKANPGKEVIRNTIIDCYAGKVVKEIVRRATVAAYRTTEW